MALYNLEVRTLDFSKNTIKLLKELEVSIINKNIINQLSRSSCSIGQIIEKLMSQIQRKISKTESGFVKEKPRKRFIGLSYYCLIIKLKKKIFCYY